MFYWLLRPKNEAEIDYQQSIHQWGAFRVAKYAFTFCTSWKTCAYVSFFFIPWHFFCVFLPRLFLYFYCVSDPLAVARRGRCFPLCSRSLVHRNRTINSEKKSRRSVAFVTSIHPPLTHGWWRGQMETISTSLVTASIMIITLTSLWTRGSWQAFCKTNWHPSQLS